MDKKVVDFASLDYILLFAISIILPTIWHWISTSKKFNEFLKFIKINTTLEDNVWDFIDKQKNDKWEVKQDYDGNNQRWVMIKMTDVKYVEIYYYSPK